MDYPGKGSWSHLNFQDHVIDLHQDDPRALPRLGELRASALPPPGVEEPNLRPRWVLAQLAPVVVPALHLHARLLELVLCEGVDLLQTFLQLTGIALPQGPIKPLGRRTAQ